MDSRGNRDASPRLWRYPRCIPGVYLYIAREREQNSSVAFWLKASSRLALSHPPSPKFFTRAEVTVMHPCERRGSHDASPLQRQPRCIPTEWCSRDASLRTWAVPAGAEDWGSCPSVPAIGCPRRHLPVPRLSATDPCRDERVGFGSVQ